MRCTEPMMAAVRHLMLCNVNVWDILTGWHMVTFLVCLGFNGRFGCRSRL